MNTAALVFAMGLAAAYNQPFRPQYHFSPLLNWTNDPNGLVYFEGEYHLFYQYNPFGDQWGHMSWGHAVSRDLIHWKELPVAIPEEGGVMIFTGSTVVDSNNTSGFCRNGKACMVAVYTGFTPPKGDTRSRQTQNLAYSNDRGRTWTKYNGNPVLDLNLSEFRDPGVFWFAPTGRWIMVVALSDLHKVRLYASPDLKNWVQLSEFGPEGATQGAWECPQLFQVPVDSNKNDTRWVLKVGVNPGGPQGGSGEQYFVGRFDGRRFVNENPSSLTLWTDYGKDCYCALVFNNLPQNHSPVMLGWMNNWQYADKIPTSPWRGQMTAPRTLALETFPEGIRLVQNPAPGFASLRRNPSPRIGTRSFEIRSAMRIGAFGEAGWKLIYADGNYVLIGYDPRLKQVFVDRRQASKDLFSPAFPVRASAPLTLSDGLLTIDALVDRCSIEIFANGGRVAITNLIFPQGKPTGFAFYTEGDAKAESMSIWPLRSIWPRR